MTRPTKDSGVEWIGETFQNWRVCKVKSLFQIRSGTTPLSSKEDYWDGNILWVTPADFNTEDKYIISGSRNITELGFIKSKLSLFPINSLIISKRAPVGKIAIAKNPLTINQGCISCVGKNKEINEVYYYYLIASATQELARNSAGTTFKEISLDSFSNIYLVYPSVEEQVFIASYLDSKCAQIDSQIDQQEALIVELEEYKKTLITEAVTKGLDPNVEMKDSGVEWIGETPIHWKIVSLKQLSVMKSGKNLTSEVINPEEGLYPVYGGNGLRGYYDQFNLDGDYLLIGRQGALSGNIHLVHGKLWATDHALITIINQDIAMLEFMNFALLAADLNQYAYETAAQPGLSTSKIYPIKIATPPIEEQSAIASYLDTKCTQIDHQIAKRKELIEKLKEYKSSLIYEVVTGKREAPTVNPLKLGELQ